MRDYYDILGVNRGCDEAGLKAAFRKLAMEHHPDRNGGCNDAAGRFKEINEAYSILSDPQKRAAYDRFGHAGLNGGGGGPQFRDASDIFSEVFGDVFGDMFGGGQRRGRGGPGGDTVPRLTTAVVNSGRARGFWNPSLPLAHIGQRQQAPRHVTGVTE